MNDEILCPTCGHSLAFHRFDYGSCEAPLGGLTSKNVCGCPLTVHTYIQNIQLKDTTKELEQLQIRHGECMNLIVEDIGVLKLAQSKIDFLQSKLKNVRELLDKPKPEEKAFPIMGWFGSDYRNEINKMIDEIKLELEKDMINE